MRCQAKGFDQPSKGGALFRLLRIKLWNQSKTHLSRYLLSQLDDNNLPEFANEKD